MLRPTLSPDDCSLVIRTDFSDGAAWEDVCAAIQAPQTADGFTASVECLSDPLCDSLSPEEVCRLLPGMGADQVVFIVDGRTLSEPEHPVLVVDTKDPGLRFRVVPSQAWGVENNLRLATMDFNAFQTAADPDGVFRGFEPSA